MNDKKSVHVFALYSVSIIYYYSNTQYVPKFNEKRK